MTQHAELDRCLNAEEKCELLRLARKTLEDVTCSKRLVRPTTSFPILREKRGAFVSLHKNKELRGCIGMVQAIKPLVETVVEMVEAAALRDPRFRPVSSHEVPQIEIEISVLSPLVQIQNVEEIVVGKHGILIEHGWRSGLLLPQVATEYGWDRKTFLEHTCLKAGLDVDAWQEKHTKILIFTADVFNDRAMKTMS